jgi:hypothetical protein
MIKIEYIVGAGLVLLWLKGRNKQATNTQIKDTIPFGGNDVAWFENMQTRLDGFGLTAAGYANLAPGAQADPGHIGVKDAKFAPAWDGGL